MKYSLMYSEKAQKQLNKLDNDEVKNYTIIQIK